VTTVFSLGDGQAAGCAAREPGGGSARLFVAGAVVVTTPPGNGRQGLDIRTC
jgi:hypothetical protein